MRGPSSSVGRWGKRCRPSATTAESTYISAEEIQEYLEVASADQQVRSLDIGGAQVQVAISHRGRLEQPEGGVAERDRAGLERLLRYCARPPFALERMEATGDGATRGERIVYRLPVRHRAAPPLSRSPPLEFLERLALLIPLSPARAPPQTDFGFDQSSGFDPGDPEPIPEYEFDQSLPD